MKSIREIIDFGIYDENEQVLIHDEGNKTIYSGYLHNIPEELINKKIDTVYSLGEYQIKKYHLNKYGWIGMILSYE